ncbi:MAG: CpsD/CapB family tyrosine-protein kinase [Pseudohongiellaceae bacterium]|nr:CpsD/CapB family tyrosine-protein kinase [Pseudohongiellaceae bacterium]
MKDSQAYSRESKWWWPVVQHRWLIVASVSLVVLGFVCLPVFLDPIFDSRALVEVRSANAQRETDSSLSSARQRTLMNTQLAVAQELSSVQELRPFTRVEWVPDTQLLAIHFQAPRPDLARDGANTVVDAYVNHTERIRNEQVKQAATRLAEEIASINGASVFQLPEIIDLRTSDDPQTLELPSQPGSAGLNALRSGAIAPALDHRLEEGLVSHLLESYEEAVSDVVRVQVMSSASLPSEAIARIPYGWLLVAAALAVLLPSCYFIARNQMRATLDFASDVSRLGYRCLGELPHTDLISAERFLSDTHYCSAMETTVAGIRTTWPAPDELSQFAQGRILMIASGQTGEGKTSAAVNLALALSRSQPVLLINGDMHQSQKMFGLEARAPGLSHLIAGAAQMRDCIHRVQDASLEFIPAGVLPPKPSDLIASARFRQILATLRRRYDTIILDTPAISDYADVKLFAEHADELIYVAAKGSSRAEELKQNLQSLAELGMSVSGIILNDCNQFTQVQGLKLRVAT